MIQWMLAILSLALQASLYIWKFSVHGELKLSLKDFEHYLASKWDEHNCMIGWTFFGIAFLWIRMKTDLFQHCGHCWVFQIWWHIECSTFIAPSLGFLNSSAEIWSPPLALFVVMLPKAHLTSYSSISGFTWVTPASFLSRSLWPFLYSSSVHSCYLFLISSAFVCLWFFCPLLCPYLHTVFLWYLQFSWRDLDSLQFYYFL